MAREGFIFLLIKLVLFLQINSKDIKIWCNSDYIELLYSDDGITWVNTNRGQSIQTPNKEFTGALTDGIFVSVSSQSKLKFVGKDIDCKITDDNKVYYSQSINDKTWIYHGTIIFGENRQFHVWEYICHFRKQYYKYDKIKITNDLEKEKFHDLNEYTHYSPNLYALGGIIYEAGNGVYQSNGYEMIRIQMKIKQDKINLEKNAGYLNVFSISNVIDINNDHKWKRKCWPCLVIFYDKSKNWFRLLVNFGGTQFFGRIMEFGIEIDITINIYTSINIISVKFDKNHEETRQYELKVMQEMLEKKLVIWIGNRYDWPLKGYIRELSVYKAKEERLPDEFNSKNLKTSSTQTERLNEMHDRDVQTIQGISDIHEETQTNIITVDNQETQVIIYKKDTDIQTMQSEHNDMEAQTSNDEQNDTNDSDDKKPNVSSTESGSNGNDNSNKDSNTKTQVIIICLTVGIIVTILNIFIIMTFRRKILKKNTTSKTKNIKKSKKKVESSLQNNIVLSEVAVTKEAKIPAPIYMNDYIDEPRINQLYKTPKYQKETTKHLNAASPSPPINTNNSDTSHQKGEHETNS